MDTEKLKDRKNTNGKADELNKLEIKEGFIKERNRKT